MAKRDAVLRLLRTVAALAGLVIATPVLIAWGFVDLLHAPAAEAIHDETAASMTAGVVKLAAGVAAGLALFLLWRYLDFREAILQERRYRDTPAYLAAGGSTAPESSVRLAVRAVLRTFGF